MFKPRDCGCKGIRTCLICEEEFGVKYPQSDAEATISKNLYEYCQLCGKAWEGRNVSTQHPNHTGLSLDFDGVLLVPDFITEDEEKILVQGCDSLPWDLSQSGRRKQNFGPKTNFKKKRINGKSFEGFPKFSQFAQEKLRSEDLLADFQTIEQCAIEYRVETGACIDPHIDDCWVWGERVISINLLSDSFLTMTRYTGPKERYNLRFYYDADADKPQEKVPMEQDSVSVQIPMPRRSLLVLFGAARYEWEHCILRSDITTRRICMAYREFTKAYLPGGQHYDDIGRDVLDRAKLFW